MKVTMPGSLMRHIVCGASKSQQAERYQRSPLRKEPSWDDFIHGFGQANPMCAEKDEWSKYDDRLMECCRRGDLLKIKATLQKKGVSPVKFDREGNTALHLCCSKQYTEAVQLMLKEQPDLSTIDIQGRTVFHISATLGDLPTLKTLVEYSRCHLDLHDNDGMTALHKSVSSGELACVKYLLDRDSPVDLKDKQGRAPLVLAIQENRDKMALTLISHGANVNTQDVSGRTPLVYACMKGMSNVVAALLSKGANAHVRDSAGKTPEMHASEAGNEDVMDVLRNGHGSKPAIEEDRLTLTDENEFNGHEEMNGHHDDVSLSSNVDGRNGEGLESPTFTEMSFTSSIIDSLRGFDINSDAMSEMSATEDQWHTREKEMENQLQKKDARIENLEVEIIDLKNRLQREFDKRLAAEDEVRLLKIQLDVFLEREAELVSSGKKKDEEDADVTFSSDEHIPDSSDKEEKVKAVEKGSATIEEDADTSSEILQDTNAEHPEVDQMELQNKENDKNHAVIHFLEEKVLGLEENISKKQDLINDLQSQIEEYKAKEDNNNNSTIALDLYNQLKVSKKQEKEAFEEEIHSLEDQVDKLEQEVRDSKRATIVLESEMSTFDQQKVKELEEEIDSLQSHNDALQDEVSVLREHMEENDIDYVETVHAYRTTLLALYQNTCDPQVNEVLKRIVAGRLGHEQEDI